jgi:hypothetical protein
MDSGKISNTEPHYPNKEWEPFKSAKNSALHRKVRKKDSKGMKNGRKTSKKQKSNFIGLKSHLEPDLRPK